MAQQQSSRLNRLLTLLDTTRLTAARQIGDIAKSHPQDLNSLLKKAMDRAHRLGQRKVVNVHRLIMRGTLEEKVMSLQRFKVLVANAVINAENASLKTMNTDQLLDLFASAETSKKGATTSKGSERSIDGDLKLMGTGKGIKAILGGLEELWDQSQYTEEYNLSQFLAKLSG